MSVTLPLRSYSAAFSELSCWSDFSLEFPIDDSPQHFAQSTPRATEIAANPSELNGQTVSIVET